MKSKSFNINQRLLDDSHELLHWDQCFIRLHKNASIPWFLVIPETKEVELCDLPDQLLFKVNRVSKVLGDYLKSRFGSQKINIAAIGNVVQQLHVHVIGRHPNDYLWPEVVWGNSYPTRQYDTQQISELSTEILEQFNQDKP